MADRCLNIGHRGASAAAPENTLASFEKAIEAGADMVELDVHLTRDRHFAVIHDKNVARTTDGTGAVTELTLDQIKRLDAGGRFSLAYSGEQIPTLEEVIELTKGRIALNVEVKASHPSEDLVVSTLLNVLAKEGVENEALVSSFSSSILKKLREQSSTLKIGFLYNVALSPLATAKTIGASAVHPNVAVVSADLVRKAHERGFTINAWTEDNPSEMRRLIVAGVDGIVTNDPFTLCKVLAETQRRKPAT